MGKRKHPLKKLREKAGLSVDTLRCLATDPQGRPLSRGVVQRLEEGGNVTIDSFFRIKEILPELEIEDCRPRYVHKRIVGTVLRKTVVPRSRKHSVGAPGPQRREVD